VRRKPFWRLVFAWKAFCFGLGTLVLAAIAVQLWFFGQVLYWNRFEPATSAFMDSRLEALREKQPRFRLRHQWVPYARISPHLKRAVVAAEDARFLDHEGFDWDAIQQAMARKERRGKIVAGASTISQQLAKNLFLSGSRSWLRKGQEALITWMLETTMPKRRILELYLNFAEFGPGTYGAEAAARRYYGISATRLSAAQSARLAAGLSRPKTWHPGAKSRSYERRVRIVLRRMAQARWILRNV
jgi:monofunctional biosynthetic peptidoglycan transglycosylase